MDFEFDYWLYTTALLYVNHNCCVLIEYKYRGEVCERQLAETNGADGTISAAAV